MKKSNAGGRNNPKNKVFIEFYAADGAFIDQRELGFMDYFRKRHDWDKPEWCKNHGVIKATGRIYDTRGVKTHDFENAYAPKSGKFIGARVVDKDGEVTVEGVFVEKEKQREKDG